jgi:hypothetical protein
MMVHVQCHAITVGSIAMKPPSLKAPRKRVQGTWTRSANRYGYAVADDGGRYEPGKN